MLLGPGCSFWSNDDACDFERYERRLQTVRTLVDAEIGTAEASDGSACRTLPFGDKPCGGPSTYLVYSAEASNPERLEILAEEYRRIDEDRNRSCGVGSTCDITPEPAVALRDGRCVAVYGGG